MQFFGPAAILASLSLGAGETIMVTGLGAWAGYQLLWLLLLSVLVKGVFVTYLMGRYTAITGQSFCHRLAALPGPRGWLLLACVLAELSVLSMGLTTVAKPCGNLLAYLQSEPYRLGFSFAAWENLWSTVLLALAFVVSQLSTFRLMERQQIVICGLLVLGTVISVFLVRPDLGQLAWGALRFGNLPAAPPWAPVAAREDYVLNLVTVFAYIGGGLSGYLAYSNWILLRGWGLASQVDAEELRLRHGASSEVRYLPTAPEQVARLHRLRTPLYWDVGLGALVLFVVTAAFMASGAAILYPRQMAIGGNEWELLTRQATIWQQIHSSLVPIYYGAVILALWGTLASIPEAITRVADEYLKVVWPNRTQRFSHDLQLGIVCWLFLATTYWIWSGVSFSTLTQVGSFVTLNVALSAVFVCAIYFNVTLPRPYRPSLLLLVGSVASAVILLCSTCGSAVGLFRKFME